MVDDVSVNLLQKRRAEIMSAISTANTVYASYKRQAIKAKEDAEHLTEQLSNVESAIDLLRASDDS